MIVVFGFGSSAQKQLRKLTLKFYQSHKCHSERKRERGRERDRVLSQMEKEQRHSGVEKTLTVTLPGNGNQQICVYGVMD